MSTFDDFNFDSMIKAEGKNPFEETGKQYQRDERFYTLEKDDAGSGSALIAFLPDLNKALIKKVFKINTTITKDGKRRFVSEYSPTTVNRPDPFQEEWARLYNSGDSAGARTFSRAVRYVVNIKVIKDPVKPENEGKIFLYDMSQTMFTKLKDALCPSEADIALGEQRKEIFNPLAGWVFQLKCAKGSNGITNYDASSFKQLPNGNTIYGLADTEENKLNVLQKAVEDIKTHSHPLSWFEDPANYMSYDDLKLKFEYVTFQNGPAAHATVAEAKSQPELNSAPDLTMPAYTEAKPQTATTAASDTKTTDNIDDMLSAIL